MSEQLDIYDDAGAHVGVKDRAAVHRDGDWHRTLHLWVVSCFGGRPSLILQRRAADKDSFPGMLDVSVGGHLQAGEQLADAVREADEELGLTVTPKQLTVAGQVRLDDRPHPGFVNREIVDVALVCDDRPLDRYQFDRGELAGVVRVPLSAMRTLAADVDAQVPAREFDGRQVRGVTVRREHCVWAPYWPALIDAAERLLAGDVAPALTRTAG